MTPARLLPVAVLFVLLVAFFASGLNHHLTLEALRENRFALLAAVERMGWVAPLLFVALYAGVAALSFPGAGILSMSGGFLFGTWLGTASSVVGATLGAIVVFLVARTAFGEPLRARAGPALRRMEAGFRRDALSYLLVLRLVPLFPFFVVNLVPAFLGVSLRTYVIATFFGIIPGGWVYASLGAGLGAVFESGADLDMSAAVTPEVAAALFGLAALSLLPVLYRRRVEARAR